MNKKNQKRQSNYKNHKCQRWYFLALKMNFVEDIVYAWIYLS